MSMTRSRRHTLQFAALLFAVALVMVSGPAAAAAAGIAEAKALYTAASYEEALAALATVDTPEGHEYRGLCYLALGRTQEAERAMEALVTSAPNYSLAGDERPPRFVTMFNNTRKRVLPGVVRKLFADAREQYQAKQLTRAKEQFDLVLALTDDPALRDVAELSDIRLLAKGFADLVNAGTPSAPAARPAAPAATTAVSTPPSGSGSAPSAPAARPPAPTSAASAATTAGPVAADPSQVVQPKIVRQNFPPVPSAVAASRRNLAGAVRIVIGTDGRVKSAAIETSLHPQYDLTLLAAARSWVYTPATINGMPTEVERTVQVRVSAN